MQVITITSDWGKGDFYLPQLKGRLSTLWHSSSEILSILDFTHDVGRFNLYEAVFILKNSFSSCPDGTIHLMAVNSEPSISSPMVIARACNHYFVGINDGRFSMLFDEQTDVEFYKIPASQDGGYPSFRAIGLFCSAVEAIKLGRLERLQDMKVKRSVPDRPVITRDRIVGRIVYRDSYGNAISNISAENFIRVYESLEQQSGREPDYTIYVNGPHIRIREISENYSGEPGDYFALFNSLGLMEIGIINGDFMQLEGLDTTAEIMVKFN